jgi:hypothetical protein
MHDPDLDDRSRRLSDRIDAFGRALADAGVDTERASRLLETAATAALHALTLELLLAPAVELGAAATAAAEPAPAEPPARIAAAA